MTNKKKNKQDHLYPLKLQQLKNCYFIKNIYTQNLQIK